MNAKILTFSSDGDKTLLEYDPATADMEEVNEMIAEYEAQPGAQPFDMATGERIEKVTRDQNEVLMVHPIAGGYPCASRLHHPTCSARLRWNWAELDAGGSPLLPRRYFY